MTYTCIEKQNQITSVDKPRSRATTKNYSTHIPGNTRKTRIDTSPQENINLTHHTKACVKPSTQQEQQKASCKITTQYFRSEFLRTRSETRKSDQDNASYKTSTWPINALIHRHQNFHFEICNHILHGKSHTRRLHCRVSSRLPPPGSLLMPPSLRENVIWSYKLYIAI
jgi:hypothetical protein